MLSIIKMINSLFVNISRCILDTLSRIKSLLFPFLYIELFLAIIEAYVFFLRFLGKKGINTFLK